MTPRTAYGQRTLSAHHLTSPEIWALEQERLFRRGWLLAGHVSELPDRGNFLLHEVGRDSVVVLRDGIGGVRAFHNACRHRGTRLCEEPRGALGGTLSCPYHAWTYELDGRLRAAPNMQGVAGFDPTAWALKPVHLAVWQGFLFVCLADRPAPFESALAGLVGRFQQWPLPALSLARSAVYEVAANWKIVFHNYNECYHCPTVHPHLERLTPSRDADNDLVEGPVLGGPMRLVDPDGSLTMTGKPCAPPLAGAAGEERGRAFYYSLFPSAFMSLLPDYVLVHRIVPLAIDRTRVVCDWYFHPDSMAAPGFDPGPAVEFWDLTNRQDWALCEAAFRGVCSSAWEPGPYSELESQLAAFDRHYLRVIGT